MSVWRRWFAWYPVRLLTLEWAWLRFVEYRPADPRDRRWSYGDYDYANPE